MQNRSHAMHKQKEKASGFEMSLFYWWFSSDILAVKWLRYFHSRKRSFFQGTGSEDGSWPGIGKADVQILFLSVSSNLVVLSIFMQIYSSAYSYQYWSKNKAKFMLSCCFFLLLLLLLRTSYWSSLGPSPVNSLFYQSRADKVGWWRVLVIYFCHRCRPWL